MSNVLAIAQAAHQVKKRLSLLTETEKNQALMLMAKAIRQQASVILEANIKDRQLAAQKGLSAAFLDRLTLNQERVAAIAAGLEAIALLLDPVGKILAEMKRPNGLEIVRVSVPIGVIAVVYESRPNVTVDAAGLCLKSGNALILRGGSDSFHSSSALMRAMHAGLAEAQLPAACIQMLDTVDRAALQELFKLDQYIDVLIPRGGKELIQFVMQESRIPVFKHLAGVCHTYVHQAADKEMARAIVLNAKMRRTGICGATEILLIDKAIAAAYLPEIIADLITAGCEIRGDEQVQQCDPRVKAAEPQDYETEFLAAIIAIKVVSDLSEAIAHIAAHSTEHTDAIITADQAAAARFLQEVDSAIVMHNTSTQFADGGEFGMGAEIGIATGKLHARGPVGLEQLTIFKYLVRGKGQIRP